MVELEPGLEQEQVLYVGFPVQVRHCRATRGAVLWGCWGGCWGNCTAGLLLGLDCTKGSVLLQQAPDALIHLL